MKYEDAVEIERLAGETFDKAQIVRAMEMMNTPSDPAEARAAYIALELARAEHGQVQSALWLAQGRAMRPARDT